MLSYTRNNLVLVTAAVAVMLVLTAGLLAWQMDAGRVSAQDSPPAGEDSSRSDHNGKLSNIEDEVSGFGGLYFEPGNEDVLKVFLTDPADADAVGKVSGAIAKQFPDTVPSGGIEVVEGSYSMSQLIPWYASLRRAIGAAGLVGNGLVFTDLHEGKNRLEVAVDSQDSVSSVRSAIAESDVPAAAVLITVTEPIVEYGSMNDGRSAGLFNLGRVSMDHQTILDRFRPLFGGLRIMGGGGTCTLGFNAIRAGVDGFVTNSHCTKRFSSLDSGKFYQPVRWPWNKVGKETVDPSTYHCSDVWTTLDCRRADAAFIEYDSSVSGEQGKIARTISNNSHTLRHDKPRWRIVSDTVAGQVGQTTVLVGRRSGTYTPAVISHVCVDIYNTKREVLMVCQNKATAQGLGEMDSGAPVFKITDSPNEGDVNLYGILWGGNDTTVFYSPVQQIQHSSELGNLRSCDPSLSC